MERTAVTLKVNKHTSDLEGLRAEEVEYEVKASEVKNGVSSAGGKHVKWPRSFFGTGDKRDRPCKVCIIRFGKTRSSKEGK